MYKVKVELFKREVAFFTEREEMDKYFKYEHTENISYSHGICIASKKKNIYCIGVFNGSLNTLVHEINHACFFICDDVGIELDSGLRETFCYLSDFLFEKLKKKIAF